MDRVLITGFRKNGFFSLNISERLEKAYEVFAPDRSQLNILDYGELNRYIVENNIRFIVHTAGHVKMIDGADNSFYNDIRIFTNILKAARDVDRVIYFGSGSEYNKDRDLDMVGEEEIGDVLPTSQQGLEKYTMNSLSQSTNNVYNLRLFSVFGKYEMWDTRFLSNLCCKALFGLPLTVRADCQYDFMFVDDLARIVENALALPLAHHDYNTCYGTPYSLVELAKMVKEIASSKQDIVLLDKENKAFNYTADNSRLMAEMKGFSFTPIKTAIESLYRYYESNKTLIDYSVLVQTL